MAHEIEAVLEPGVRTVGRVCPGEWIYHTLNQVAPGQDATFQLELHTGDLYYTLRPLRPAITLVRTTVASANAVLPGKSVFW